MEQIMEELTGLCLAYISGKSIASADGLISNIVDEYEDGNITESEKDWLIMSLRVNDSE